MDKKSPSITFQNKMTHIKNEYNELGNLTLELNKNVVNLLEKYSETQYTNLTEYLNKIDIKTIDLERYCIKFMATQHPMAKDLMFIESTLRVISHMKRIAHLSLKIAKSIKNIQKIKLPERIQKELEYMGEYIQLMLKKSFTLFLNQDIEKAKELSADDDKIDELYDSILNQITTINNIPELQPYIVDIIFLARYFERIADKSVSIASRTIFMVTLKRPGIDK